jgi:proline iminopeptidase
MMMATRARDLYPRIESAESGRLAVGDGHEIHWETAGNPEGKPVVFLHGGPGAGCSADHRRFFDPAVWRIVLFDQRGAGRSTPRGSLENNTTQALIGDIEALRAELGVERWTVFGGSWGSTLGLAYAEAHPQAVAALVLRGIFLARDAEIDWFLFGMGRFFPEEHARFLEALPEGERGRPLESYYRRLSDPDPQVHLPAARAWSRYEGACSTLLPSPETVNAFSRDSLALPLARMEAHYFAHRCFLEEGQLLRELDRVREARIPGVIVQGRYDVICPPGAAWDLHAAWPEARFTVVPDAGHSAMEPGVRRALVEATDSLR